MDSGYLLQSYANGLNFSFEPYSKLFELFLEWWNLGPTLDFVSGRS